MAVHESLVFYTTDDKFYVESRDDGTNEILVIDRLSQEITLQESSGQIPPYATSKPISGLMGTIRLLAGPYLVIITQKSKVGEINGQTIWKITGHEIIPYKRTTMHLNEQQYIFHTALEVQKLREALQAEWHTLPHWLFQRLVESALPQEQQDNRTYESMVNYVLESCSCFFSTTYDLTHSLQRLYNTSPEFLQMPLFERADPRFVWNGHLLREFASQPELGRFILPVMCGFVAVRIGILHGKRFDYIVISRRSCFRAGTRYYMRGLDAEGHVANFVETEQIVQYKGWRGSFVQTRGSIPLYWSQRPNITYKPKILISQAQNHLDGFMRHLDSQVVSYGDQVLVNLIDHRGIEDRLEKSFAKAVIDSQNKSIKYESFDFHHECRRMRWDRLSILIDRLTPHQDKYGSFILGPTDQLTQHQTGVFRTNCMDCLDRTNVVQSLLARRILQKQLEFFGILNKGESLDNHLNTAFESTFKNTWADNADFCAKQYAGTGALKTDFTRTGKRTHWGMLKDLYNSMIRYYMNNFVDGYRQDSIDLFLGNHIVEETEGISTPSPLRQKGDPKFLLLPVICIVAFSMVIISILIPAADFFLQLAYVFFWMVATAVCLGFIFLYGLEFVNQPKLAQAKAKLD